MAIASVGVIAFAWLGWWLASRSGHASRPVLDAGPLATPPAFPTQDGIAIDPGSPFTFGQAVLVNHSASTATIQSAALSPNTLGLRSLGVYVRSARGIAIASGTSMRGLSTLHGYQLRPGQAVAIVFHLELSRTGVVRTSGVLVLYEIGGNNYSLVLPQSLKACAPRAQFLGRC